MPIEKKRILILCKTYPTPSARYAELSCVAGIDEAGDTIRLFPIPFRLISNENQFAKWQWISASVSKSKKDHRPESHTISVDTIQTQGDPISTKNGWKARRQYIEKIPSFHDFAAIEVSRKATGKTIGIVRPDRVIRLEITPTPDPNWTADDIEKLEQHQKQAGLFDDAEAKSIRRLNKIPFDFHYVYECDSPLGAIEYRHKIVDWEIGALYLTCVRKYGANWQTPFRKKIESDLPTKDLMFLMGTIHRFPDKWLIISLIYPPNVAEDGQGVLPL